MNWFQFLRLIHSIYGRGPGLPDLEWIQRLGLLAVKLAQVHALRIDFLPREKCEHLAKLYRQNLSLPPQEFRNLLERQAPPGFRTRFSSLEEVPLASASVGQVHRGRLLSGQDVAVKIVKRDVRERFQRDVASLRRLFRVVTFFYPKLRQVGDPVGILNDIEEYTLSELDLRHEVAGQAVLQDIAAAWRGRVDLGQLAFARVHQDLCNQNVLVTDFIPGLTLDELLAQKSLPYERLLDLFHVHGFYMFIAGTFHGDIHPGNVIVSGDKLVFVDTGFIGRVGDKIRRGLFDFFAALAYYEYPACARALNRMSEVELTGAAFDTFAGRFNELYRDFTDATVSRVSLTRQMMQTIKLGVNSGMVFEKGIFAIIRSLMYLDGMVLRCNPQAVLVRDMRRFIGEFQDWLTGQNR
jgi:ubiquinone biosynthesis protein